MFHQLYENEISSKQWVQMDRCNLETISVSTDDFNDKFADLIYKQDHIIRNEKKWKLTKEGQKNDLSSSDVVFLNQNVTKIISPKYFRNPQICYGGIAVSSFLPTESDSELSFDYQYKPREADEELPYQSFKGSSNVESQRHSEKATLDEFLHPLKEDEPIEYSMSLAQRTKSGIWALFPDGTKKKYLPMDIEEGTEETSAESSFVGKISVKTISETTISETEDESDAETIRPLLKVTSEVKPKKISFETPKKASKPKISIAPKRLSIQPDDLKNVSLRRVETHLYDRQKIFESDTSESSQELPKIKRVSIKEPSKDVLTGISMDLSSKRNVPKSAHLIETWIKTGSLYKDESKEAIKVESSPILKEKKRFKTILENILRKRDGKRERPEEEHKLIKLDRPMESDKQIEKKKWFKWNFGTGKVKLQNEGKRSDKRVVEDEQARLSYQGADNFRNREHKIPEKDPFGVQNAIYRERARRLGNNYVDVPLVSFRGSSPDLEKPSFMTMKTTPSAAKLAHERFKPSDEES